MTYPREIGELVLVDPAVPAKLAEFRDQKAKRITVGWSKTFSEEAPAGARPSRVSTDVGWTFTFTRAKKKSGRWGRPASAGPARWATH